MMAAASTRILNVEPLMRTRLVGASVAGTRTPFPTPLVPNKIAYSRGGEGLRHAFCYVAATGTLGSQPRSLFAVHMRLCPARYANSGLLVYQHTHHVDTNR